MATKQDVLDAIAKERQQVVDAFAAANTAQDAKVQELKDQITALQAAGNASSADFDELITAVDGIFNVAPVLPAPVVADPPAPADPVV